MVKATGVEGDSGAALLAAKRPAMPLPTDHEFGLIADSAPVPMWVTGPDGRRAFVNRAYIEFLGVSHDDALAFDWRTILHPGDVARVTAEAIAGEQSGRKFSLEGRYRHADGSWRHIQSVSQPRIAADGSHIGFIGVAHDVTIAREAARTMREREEQFSAFISQSTAGFGQVDLEGRFTLVNDRFCEVTGYSREELMGRTMQSITHPDDLVRNIPLFQRAVADGTPYTHEKRYIRKDGGVVWVNNSVSVIRRPDGEPYGVLAVTLDVTARRQSDEALRRSEERLRLATEGSGMATWELDLDTMRGEWSSNRFDLLGLPRTADLSGTAEEWLRLIHPDDAPMARKAAFRCFEQGVPYTIEYRVHRADTGEERWLQSYGSRISDEHGGRGRFVGVSFDITDRKESDARLRESDARFRAIFHQANDYIFTSDLDQVVISANPAVAAALGYTPEELIGRRFSEFLDPADQFQANEMLRRKLMEGGTTSYTVRVHTGDERQLIWDVRSRLLLGADGKPAALFAIARDVTEAKHAEALQRLLIDELNHRVKNTLAIVQGIAQQTFKTGADPVIARRAFEGRLGALSHAHNLLTRESWAPVAMSRIIGDAVATHGGDSDRFTVVGPELMLSPKTSISLALAIHELATNATKHGALSVPQGAVDIAWSTYDGATGRRLRLTWTEHGGPRVSQPQTRGFGTRMIERGLAAEFGGSAVIDFAESGLRCTLDAPLPEANG